MQVSETPQGLCVEAPWNRDFITELKKLPPDTRRWDPVQRVWMVDTSQALVLSNLLRKYFGYEYIPAHRKPADNYKYTLKIMYVADCRTFADGKAYSWCHGETGWVAVIAEDVLRTWFNQPEGATTLYGILCVSTGSDNQMIRSAYYKLAKAWHPDVNPDPLAASRFKEIKAAYEILSDERRRKKYDYGLRLSPATVPEKTVKFSPPYRCGHLTVHGSMKLGMVRVEKIEEWTPITDAFGRTQISYWPHGSKNYEVKYV